MKNEVAESGCSLSKPIPSMSDLPIELLELVFNFCYLGSLENDEDFSFSTLFPYHLAEVDPLWKDILLNFPEYWTRVISKSSTGEEEVSSKLFGVAIIRRSGTNPDDAAEKARVRKFLDLLEPHMSQFGASLINVYASSSLPSITTDFIHVPPTSMYLCDVDDNPGSKCEDQMPSYIFMMVLHGCAFARDQSWLRDHKMLVSLSQHSSNLRIPDVNWALQTTFEMTTFEMTTSPTTSIEHLGAGDVTTNILKFFERRTQIIYPDPAYARHLHIHLTRGAFLGEIPLPTQCGNLILEGYNPADFIITRPFDRKTFVSSQLHLINCPGFSDSQLELLSKVDPVTNWPSFSFDLKCLELTGCNNFTIEALKVMVNVRGRFHSLGFLRRRNLISLEVSGYGAPLAVEDGNWIADRLRYFSWDSRVFLGTH